MKTAFRSASGVTSFCLWLVCLGLFVPSGDAAALGNRPPSIVLFQSTPNNGAQPLAVTFAWRVVDPDGDSLTCLLDANNDGTDDYVLPACTSTTSQTHTYDVLGTQLAKLHVKDGRGGVAAANAVTQVSKGGTWSVPANHPRILLNGPERTRLSARLQRGDAAAVRFKSIVDRAVAGEDVYGYQAWYSALMGVLTQSPPYCAHAVARTEAWVAAEEALIAAGGRPAVSNDSYLEVGPIVGDVALVYDWCWPSLTSAQKTRWGAYAAQAVWNVWNYENASWGGRPYPWSGWSVNNPVNNYYYSFLRATVLLGLATHRERVDALRWITKFRNKITRQLVPVFNRDLTGGGSREGTGYGTAMAELFRLYHLWETTTGERLADLTSHTWYSMPYLLNAIVPSKDRLAPIGDHARDSTAALYDYHRAYLLALAWLYRDTPLARTVRANLAASSVPVMERPENWVYDFLYDAANAPGPSLVLPIAYHARGTGHLFVRSGWNPDASWWGFLAGPYTESHAHHDALSLLLNKNGWLVYDGNIDSHSGIHQEEEVHGLVRLEEGGQTLRMAEGGSARMTALHSTNRYLYAAANSGNLYGASLPRVQREIVFVPPGALIVFDRIDSGTTPALGTFQLPTPYQPSLSGTTAVIDNGKSRLTVHRVLPAAAEVSVLALPAFDSDINGGYRLDIKQQATGLQHFLNVLSLDGAVSSVAEWSNAVGRGADVRLADSRRITVRFNIGNPGGVLKITNAAGTVLANTPLYQVVQQLPLTVP